MNKQALCDLIDRKADFLNDLSDRIWDHPELAFGEHISAKILMGGLLQEGFRVEKNVAEIETAFLGRYGYGRPVIGILGEFDALTGLSQEAGCAEKRPLNEGGYGHGCGHNNLGVGSLAAAIAIKEYLQVTGKSGTVIYYGCPGEEGGSGKTFMAREGVFDELDCALCWHPSTVNSVISGSHLANYQILYSFQGVAAHAAGAPHLGRSALDAVELMNIGVNFLREHVVQEARMHYAIVDAGGKSPNVVQPKAQVLYLLRAPKTSQVQEIYERVNDIAKGAALMTGTQVEIQFIKACSNTVPNKALEKVMYKNMMEIPLPEYTDQDKVFAAAINDSVENKGRPFEGQRRVGASEEVMEELLAHVGKPIYDFVVPLIHGEQALGGSTDVGDVSWVCPTVQLNAATWAANTPGHSWQVVAQGKSALAHKSTLYAGKVLAGTAIDLLEEPELLCKAKEEHHKKLGGSYICPIPKGVNPRSMEG
ncbi:MAG: amidohydrolase [Lachnospiraceae bacterium]|nr:amidohydrolase [Lachnospiraceae bacterium]